MPSERSRLPEELPSAKIRGKKRTLPFIWIVPVVAALVAGILIANHIREYGSTLVIRLKNADGLKSGQTTLQYRGVVIGEVGAIVVSSDQQYAVVRVKLKRFASSVARKGSAFWVVRPQFTMGAITGLGTIITGPHIEVLPGNGEPAKDFVGAEESPVTHEPNGLRVALTAARAESLRAGVPIYYRGIEVGSVLQTQLSTNASSVVIDVTIKHRYAKLVRTGSKFWNVTGLDVKFGIFRGAEINVESLKSLVVGGIAFATPDEPSGAPAESGAVFQLNDQSREEWLKWAPQIEIPTEEASDKRGESPKD
jgi:paraquat-inducible protein B